MSGFCPGIKRTQAQSLFLPGELLFSVCCPPFRPEKEPQQPQKEWELASMPHCPRNIFILQFYCSRSENKTFSDSKGAGRKTWSIYCKIFTQMILKALLCMDFGPAFFFFSCGSAVKHQLLLMYLGE